MSKSTAWKTTRARRILTYLSMAMFAGCTSDGALTGVNDDGSLDVPDLSTAELSAVSGQEQVGVVGSILPDPLVVEVIAADGAPIVRAPVQWVFTAGQGLTDPETPSDSPTQVVRMETDSEGKAQIWWELGTRRGQQTATVSILDTASTSVSGGPSGAPGGNGKGKMLGLTARAEAGSVSNVDVIPDSASLEVQDTLRLEAVVTDAYGNVIDGAEVAWSSSDNAVATVDTTGLLDPAATGDAIVTASSGEVSADATVTVVSEATTDSTGIMVPDPDQVTDLTVRSVSTSSVTLRWISVDDGVGRGANYALRVGSPSISWGSADSLQVLIDGSTMGIGSVHEYVWPALDAGTTYEFQLVAYRGSIQDGTAVFSDRSNTASGTTAEDPPSDGGSEPTGDVVFRSDWSTSVGTNATAVMDGGVWDEWYCGEFAGGEPRGVLEVVPGSSFDWTLTPNVLQVTMDGEQCGQLEESRRVPDGVDYYIRSYIMVLDALNNTNNHPYKTSFSGSQGAMLWAIRDPTGAGGTYRPAIRTIPQQWTDPDVNQTYAVQYTGPVLNQGEWYRFEHMIEYVGDPALGHTRVWPRIYNVANELIADEHDFYWAEAGKTLAESYADGAVRQHPAVDGSVFNAITHLNLGYEGPAGSSPGNERYFFGGVEVRTGGWPGPLQPR